jgi:hypothetical protein
MNVNSWQVGVIGAGPAGMTAALEACQTKAQVILLDANPTPGRKLAATGSGRANLTNANMRAAKYTCSSLEFVDQALQQFGQPELIHWLKEKGIFTYSSPDGWCYPLSDSAANVAQIFYAHLIASGAKVITQTLITDITPKEDGFRLSTSDPNQSFYVNRLIVACGSPAYPQLGARDNLPPILEKIGHTIHPIQPSLAPLLCDVHPIHKLQGVRLDAGVKLLMEGEVIGETVGNIIFTNWGLNGPGVMDLSHLVNRNKKRTLEIELNLIPQHLPLLNSLLEKRAHDSLPIGTLLGSVLPTKITAWALERTRLPLDCHINQLDKRTIQQLLDGLQHLRLSVKGTKGFKDCQASIGGVAVEEVDAGSMQSQIIPGLFLAGEVLDVSGPCGGYNLQWAFTSGFIAGKSAGNSL